MGVYVFRNNQVEGPFDELVLQQALANGTMAAGEQVCREGSEEWTAASRIFPFPPPSERRAPSLRLSRWFPRINQLSRLNVGLIILGTVTALFVGLICICVTFAPPSNLGATAINLTKSTLSEDIAKLEQNITEEDQYLVRFDREISHLDTSTEHGMSYAFDLAAATTKVEDQQKKDQAALQELYRLRDQGLR